MQRKLRLCKELPMLKLQEEYFCWEIGDSLDHLQADLKGPANSPYENGIFHLDIKIPSMYPFEPPIMKFLTPIYHPNIDNSGRICHDVLKMPPKGGWRPHFNLNLVLKNLYLLLIEPNPEDGLMGDIVSGYSVLISRRTWRIIGYRIHEK